MNESKVNAAGMELGERVLTLGERVASLEEAMKHVATKAWVLGGVIAGFVVTTTLVLALVKLFQ